MLGEDYEIENEMVDDIAGENGQKKEWKIDSDILADWAIEKIKEEMADYSRKEIVANNKIAMIKNWLVYQVKEKDDKIAFFEGKLHEYFNSLSKDAKKETKTQVSYQLPAGTLKLKNQDPAYEQDDEKLIKWLRQNDLSKYIKVTEAPDWKGLKDYLKGKSEISNNSIILKTGEIVDGITVTERGKVFSVEAK